MDQDRANFDCLNTFLAAQGYTNPGLCEAWLACSKTQFYQKSEIILRAGTPSTTLGLIRSGIVRYYYSNPDGKIWNKAFYAEGHTVSAASATLTNRPSPFTIEALEPSEVITIPNAKLYELMDTYPEIALLIAQLITAAFVRNEQREAMLLTRNAEQRFLWLLKYEPHLLKRVPQFHLASYIGIDAVSLSRIKRKLGN